MQCQGVGGGVITVVNDDDLRMQRRYCRAEPVEEHFNIAFLIAQRDNHGEIGGAAGSRRLIKAHQSQMPCALSLQIIGC